MDITRIAEADEQYGPVAAAGEAALALLSLVGEFDHFCNRHDPDQGVMPVGDYSKKQQKELASKLTDLCNDLREAIAILSGYLDRKQVWDSLCAANDYPATIGGFHGPCYAEAAYKLGRDRYYWVWLVLDHDQPIRGVDADMLPPVPPNAISNRGVEGVIRGCAMAAKEWDEELAQWQLHKEYKRQAGPEAANREKFNRGAKVFDCPVEFRSPPLTAKEVAANMGVTEHSKPSKWIDESALPHERIGKKYVVDIRRYATKKA